MGLEQVGVKMTERGLIEIDKQCRTNVPNIYAIGDIVAGPQLAHKASYEGKIAAEAMQDNRLRLTILEFQQLFSLNQNLHLLVILKKS